MIEWLSHTSDRLEEQYSETRLPCGLRILVCPKERHTYHAALTVGYGSMDRFACCEGGRTLPMGTAHFLEHKMFARDPDRFDGSDSYDDDFAALGAESNAYTSHDHTVYYFSCADRFEEALETLLSMVSELYVTPASVSGERSIIAEEIRMNDDDPWERCCMQARAALFGRHPIGEEICGSLSSIRRITPAVLREAFDIFYRPDNMILTVCGRVTPEAVLAVALRVMGEGGAAPSPRLSPRSPRIRLSPAAFISKTVLHKPVAKPLFCVSVKCPDPPADKRSLWKRDMTVAVLCEMLFSRSGDLYDSLFEQGLISPGISYGYLVGSPCHLPACATYGCLDLSGESDSPERVLAELMTYMQGVREEGLSADDLVRAKRVLCSDFLASFDTTEDTAALLGGYAADGLCAYDFFAAVESITLDDVMGLFEKTFRDSQYTLSVILPAEDAE